MPLALYLDDNRDPPPGWVCVRNAEDVMLALLTTEVDRLSLDYDLDEPDCNICNFSCGLRETGCQHRCQCHNNGKVTGMGLLNWMEMRNRWPKTKPEVHSANEHHAPLMQEFIDEHFPR